MSVSDNITTTSKAKLLRALDMALYDAYDTHTIITNGNFVIDLRPVPKNSQWTETIDRERTKALKRLIKKVKKTNKSLFQVGE